METENYLSYEHLQKYDELCKKNPDIMRDMVGNQRITGKSYSYAKDEFITELKNIKRYLTIQYPGCSHKQEIHFDTTKQEKFIQDFKNSYQTSL